MGGYYEPGTDFTCRRCKRLVKLEQQDVTWAEAALINYVAETNAFVIRGQMVACRACSEYTLRMGVFNATLDSNRTVTRLANGRFPVGFAVRDEQVRPESNAQDFPDVPPAIMRDYTEAARVAERSPRAGAILTRRALESFLAIRFDIRAGSLKARLQQLRTCAVLNPAILDALGGIRVLGNDAAHAGNDKDVTDEDIWQSDLGKDDVNDALRGLEILFDATYVQDRRTDFALQQLKAIADREGS